ncbi:ATP-binding protein [Marinilabiliaceae bacterium ANBcel2]|nr:ATP-binding protein [Marinilabiliaceae bacterium ANBcel2]
MISGISYRKTLFIYFLTIFVVLISVITIVQYNREKNYRAQELKSILETYTDLTDNFIKINGIDKTLNFEVVDSLKSFFPREDIRITVMANTGEVLYDSFHKNPSGMVNHISRPEFKQAIVANSGTDIRLSESTNQEFFYFAKKYNQYSIRAAAIYGGSLQEFLKVESVFWYLVGILFLFTTMVLLYVSDTIGKSILKLKDFAVKAAKDESLDSPISFPDNELGVIGKKIVDLYSGLQRSNRAISNEREKLIQHIHIAKEGIAIFSEYKRVIMANNYFVQYSNLLCDKVFERIEDVLDIEEMIEINEFVNKSVSSEDFFSYKQLPVKRLSISKDLRYFEVQCIIFYDKSFEISISDVTQSVKQKKLKQEMTANIAHELRTPVTSVKGYLDTILTSKDIEADKINYFVEKASLQVDRLSQLIQDIALLTKIEESAQLYKMERVFVKDIIDDVLENLSSNISRSSANIEVNVNKDATVKGNRALLFSIFQNLVENALNYAGDNVTVLINQYMKDKSKLYFVVSDNGCGINEKYHSRIFERFYRVEKGRDRRSGGTGLGLAIVKHAIELHGSGIDVKTREGGGTEFYFALERV